MVTKLPCLALALNFSSWWIRCATSDCSNSTLSCASCACWAARAHQVSKSLFSPTVQEPSLQVVAKPGQQVHLYHFTEQELKGLHFILRPCRPCETCRRDARGREHVIATKFRVPSYAFTCDLAFATEWHKLSWHCSLKDGLSKLWYSLRCAELGAADQQHIVWKIV